MVQSLRHTASAPAYVLRLPLSVAAEMIKNRLAFFGKSAVEVWISFVGFMKHKKETTRSAQKRVVSAFTATTLESGGLFFLFFFISVASQFFLKHDMQIRIKHIQADITNRLLERLR